MTTTPLPGSKFASWTELLTSVESNNGVYQITMETLRQLEGAQRLGPNVLNAIDDRLRTLGFGHLPEVLPNRGQAFVVLYRVGTPAHDTIEAIKKGITSAGNSTYDALWRLNSAPSPDEVVEVDEVRAKAVGAAAAVLELLSGSGLVQETAAARKAVADLLPDADTPEDLVKR